MNGTDAYTYIQFGGGHIEYNPDTGILLLRGGTVAYGGGSSGGNWSVPGAIPYDFYLLK